MPGKTEDELRDQFKSRIFGLELKRQCTFALISMDDVIACLRGMDSLHKSERSMMNSWRKSKPSSPPRPGAGDFAMGHMDKFRQQFGPLKSRLWYSLQNFLVATANVSKLLWDGNRDKTKAIIGKARGKKLREIYGIEEKSPLNDRNIRNHFEHFDERIDSWAASSARMSFVDSNIGPKDSIAGPAKSDYFRNFDPTKCILSYADEDYELITVNEAIKCLYEKVTEILASLPGEQPSRHR
jgi:hypothetical protein